MPILTKAKASTKRFIYEKSKPFPCIHKALKITYARANRLRSQIYERAKSNKPSPHVKAFLESLDKKNKALLSPAYSAENPAVSIVVLNWNKSELTKSCIREIHRNTTGVPFEIIVVDNGSSDDDFANLTTLSLPFRVIRLKTNRYYGEGNNIGVSEAKGSLIFLLNNDAFVTPNWALPMVSLINGDPTIGAVGPKLIFPDGRLQEAGSTISEHGVPGQIGKFDSPENKQFCTSYEVDYSSAAALLVRKSDFDLINGFDMQWEPAYFEDVDLCLKIKSLGKKIWYEHTSTVIHIENFTTKDPKNNLNFNNLISLNHRKFIQKWQGYIKNRSFNDKAVVPDLLGYVDETNEPSLVAGVYTPYNLTPGGGEKFLFSFISAISKKYKVELILDEVYSPYRIRGLYKELAIDPALISIRKKETLGQQQYDLFICLGNEILPPMPALGQSRNFYICQFPFPISSTDLTKRWSYLDQYDKIIAYSNYSKTHISQRISHHNLPAKEIVVVAPPCGKIDALPIKQKHNETLHFITVGRFFKGGHCKNHHETVGLFLNLKKQLPEIKMELHIAGAVSADTNSSQYYNDVRLLSEGHPIHLYPNISPDELTDLYRQSSFYIHTAGYKADHLLNPEKMEHFGITIVEAMSFGLVPIVYAQGGPAEIVSDGQNGIHYRSSQEFVEKTSKILGDRAHQEVMSEAAQKHALIYSNREFEKNILSLV